ncbi:Polycystic kidney disease 2-like 1 protein [Hondaea fermentalgiana]|uniref:Polycystic kidney disease 2-like 1 protein n=1 Tax=Hondaea fermentalgiana TaxID=2315210 RepID=A0A2R5GPB2_9STRA|nr:Polycystic kidney disease 2-like 1 protein [Hondaea fermentalgiana]|eukprot:GBG31618.1 Polycystic kidney disease 2-like 1 protein [Hondaea fermentalgiana]
MPTRAANEPTDEEVFAPPAPTPSPAVHRPNMVNGGGGDDDDAKERELDELDSAANEHGLRNIASINDMKADDGPDGRVGSTSTGSSTSNSEDLDRLSECASGQNTPFGSSAAASGVSDRLFETEKAMYKTPRNSYMTANHQDSLSGVGLGEITNAPALPPRRTLAPRPESSGPTDTLLPFGTTNEAPAGVHVLHPPNDANGEGGDGDSNPGDGDSVPGSSDDSSEGEPLASGIPLFEIYKATRLFKVQSRALEGIFFLVFMLAFCFVFIDLRVTVLAGETTETLLDFFIEEEFVELDVPGLEGAPFFQKTYRDVKTTEEWWRWALGPLSNGLWADFSDNGTYPRGLPQQDSQNYILGGANGGILFRTARVTSDSCTRASFATEQMRELASNDNAVECFGRWPDIDINDPGANQNVDTTTFGPLSDGNISAKAQSAFTFTKDIETSLEGTLLGQMYFQRNNYGIGAFMVDLPVNNFGSASTNVLKELFSNNWIDLATRVVSVEFNVYNPSTNVVTAVRFFTEIAHTGMIRPSFRFYHINALLWENMRGGQIAATAIFLVLLLRLSARWFNRIFTCSRWETLLRWEVVFDTILVFLFWSSIIMISMVTQHSRVVRSSRFSETVSSDTFTPGIFENAELMHSVDALCSINLMLATVKLISYLPFKTTRTIWSTLGGAVKDVVVLGIVVLVFWAGFSVGSHLTFGSLGFFDFNRIDRTFGTLMVLMFSGSIEFNAMREVSFTAAPLFYSIYMIFMWGVMLNLFVAIIVLTYERHTQWQANFETWSDLHQGTNSGCIIMSFLDRQIHRCRQYWYMLRCIILKQFSPKASTLRGATVRDSDIENGTAAASVDTEEVRADEHEVTDDINQNGDIGATGATGARSQMIELTESAERGGALNVAISVAIQTSFRGTPVGTVAMKRRPECELPKSGLAKYERFSTLLKQEKELAMHKLIIEKALRETQHLFQKHRLSFNRLMRSTWDHAADNERLMEVNFAELKEMFTPGCSPGKCSFCAEETKAIEERTKALLRSYHYLQRHKAVFDGNRRRVIRVRRVVDLSMRMPPPVQRAMSTNTHGSAFDTMWNPRQLHR